MSHTLIEQAILRVVDSCGGADTIDESADWNRGYNDALKAVEREMKRYFARCPMTLDWQQWETAPEDGSVILAWREDAGVFTAHYVEEDAHLSSPMNPPEGECYWFTTGGEDLTNELPTYWMPLPAHPMTPVTRTQIAGEK